MEVEKVTESFAELERNVTFVMRAVAVFAAVAASISAYYFVMEYL